MVKRNIDVVYGAGYSDEGKGVVVDRVFDRIKHKYIIRCNAGTNASHRICTESYEMVTRHLPSVVVKSESDTILVLAPGMVLNLRMFVGELSERVDKDELYGHVLIASNIPLVLEGYIEKNKNEVTGSEFGSTNQGTGVTNTCRVKRHCLRLYDLKCPVDVIESKIRFNYEQLGLDVSNVGVVAAELKESYQQIMQILGEECICDYTRLIRDINDGEEGVLVEGCNGALICNMFGQHPYVTSCMTTANALLAYTNLDAFRLRYVHAVMGAYICCLNKRVFPTEITDENVIRHIREKCNEVDPAENMERRVGWFDVPAIRKALPYTSAKIRQSTFSPEFGDYPDYGVILHLNKFDVLEGLDSVKICTGYVDSLTGDEYEIMPDDEYVLKRIQPVYKELSGWNNSCSQAADAYIRELTWRLGACVWWVGMGHKTKDYVERKRIAEWKLESDKINKTKEKEERLAKSWVDRVKDIDYRLTGTGTGWVPKDKFEEAWLNTRKWFKDQIEKAADMKSLQEGWKRFERLVHKYSRGVKRADDNGMYKGMLYQADMMNGCDGVDSMCCVYAEVVLNNDEKWQGALAKMSKNPLCSGWILMEINHRMWEDPVRYEQRMYDLLNNERLGCYFTFVYVSGRKYMIDYGGEMFDKIEEIHIMCLRMYMQRWNKRCKDFSMEKISKSAFMDAIWKDMILDSNDDMDGLKLAFCEVCKEHGINMLRLKNVTVRYVESLESYIYHTTPYD